MLKKICWWWVLTLAMVLALLVFALIQPSSTRNWIPEHVIMPQAEFHGDQVFITGIRNYQTRPDSTVSRNYYDRTFDLSTLQSLWYCLAVFDRDDDWRGPAHSLFSFGFADSSFVAISVEARKEVGEDYSICQGLVKKYELIYVIGDERNLILTRAAYRPDDVYLYPVQASPEKIRELFEGMLTKANDLITNPEFYNTLTNNCTTRSRDHVNEVAPGLVPLSWKVQLPGYSDELARDLELIDDSIPLEEARRRFWINDRARLFAEDPDFSLKIRRYSRHSEVGT